MIEELRGAIDGMGNQDGVASYAELCDMASAMHGMELSHFVDYYGEDYDWEADQYMLTDMVSTGFDADWDQTLTKEEFGNMLSAFGKPAELAG
jgi:hypothetical protein